MHIYHKNKYSSALSLNWVVSIMLQAIGLNPCWLTHCGFVKLYYISCSSLIQEMAWRRIVDKPLPAAKLAYYHLEHQEQISVMVYKNMSKTISFGRLWLYTYQSTKKQKTKTKSNKANNKQTNNKQVLNIHRCKIQNTLEEILVEIIHLIQMRSIVTSSIQCYNESSGGTYIYGIIWIWHIYLFIYADTAFQRPCPPHLMPFT